MSPDVRLAESANAFAQQHDGGEDAARAYAHLSEPLFIAGVISLAIAGLALHRPPVLSASVMAIAAAGVAVTIAAVRARVVNRPRPFVVHPQIHLFLAHAPDRVPSDHVTAALAIAVRLLRLGRRAPPVLLGGVITSERG